MRPEGFLDAFAAAIADAVAERLDAANPDRLLRAAEAAKLLSVTERWVRDATRDERLPCVRLGGNVRYRRDELIRYIDEHSNAGRPYRPRRHDGGNA